MEIRGAAVGVVCGVVEVVDFVVGGWEQIESWAWQSFQLWFVVNAKPETKF